MQASTNQPAFALLFDRNTPGCAFPDDVVDLACPEECEALLAWANQHGRYPFDLVLQRGDAIGPDGHPGRLVGRLSDVEHRDGPLVSGELRYWVSRIIIRDPIWPVSCRAWFQGMDIPEFDTDVETPLPNLQQPGRHGWTRVYGLENLDMAQCRDTSLMFAGCMPLDTARLAAWDLSNCRHADRMFAGCIQLGTVKLPSSLPHLESAQGMFAGCSMLHGKLDLSDIAALKLASVAGMFTGCDSLSSIGFPHAAPADASYLFAGCTSLESVENLDLSSCTNARALFACCSSLRTVKLDDWTGSRLIDTSVMFYGCSSLAKADLRCLVAPKLRNASGMFGQCRSLTTVRLANLAPASGWDASLMFADCSWLSSASLCRKAPSAPVSTAGMFQRCDNLLSLDVRGLALDRCADVHGMFDGCKSSLALKPSGKGFRSALETRGAFDSPE